MQKHFEKRLRLNNQIRVPDIQVIDAEGGKLGVMATHEALKLAYERGLDLVEVGPNAKPPIVKIMDYGKYMYQKGKRERDHKSSKSHTQELKTVRIGFRTESHDLGIRANQVSKFLEKGHKVRIELTLRGREKSMSEMGRVKLQNFVKTIAEPYIAEDPIKRFPGGFGTLIRPDKK